MTSFLTVQFIARKIQLLQRRQLRQFLRYRPYTVNESNGVGKNVIAWVVVFDPLTVLDYQL